MEDKKIIDGYELARAILDTGMKRQDSTLMMISGIVSKFVDDAPDELLKEQEAKPPAIMQDIEGIWSTCSMCGHKLRPILAMKMDTYFPKFCPECGHAVKWD